jgi:CHAT domain-containing protein
VQSALGQGEAAIEFAHYQFLAPQPTATTNYVALVLLPGATAPYFVPLFEEKQLAALLPKRNESGKLPAEGLNRLYAANTSQLYALLWKPLEPYLAGVKTIYFSPTGLLHQLDIPAIGLPGGKGAILADRYAMVDMGSTRQLAAPKAEAVAGLEVDGQHRFSGQEALLFGGIDYDLDSTAIAQHSTVPSDELDAELSLRNRGLQLDWMDSTDRGGTWSALPWTMVEVVALEQMLKEQGLRPTLLQGSAATEEAFKQRKGQGPLILHLATHGYFFPAPKKADAQQGPEAGQVIKTSALPMIRSGLILAGGNYAWKEGKPAKAGMEDGILTAYEISQMNLANTELVVLSACETGLGDIQGNEGVYGLQRAFKIAGAKYIIMSLWQVPDYQTQQLMSSFYDFWLQGKLPIPDAFRSAQKTMREKFADPFYWAGFLLVQ